MIDLKRVEEFATGFHSGQFRRDGVTPYIRHPEDVAKQLKGRPAEWVAVAWLHDILEDTTCTEADLRHILEAPESVIEAVVLLTKKEGQHYLEYLEALRANEIARMVKIADMVSNLSDKPTTKQIRKYATGLLRLIP